MRASEPSLRDFSFEKFIDFEEHKMLEQLEFQKYIKNIKDIYNKNDNEVAQELCSRILEETVIDEESIFGEVHMFKTWYDRLFSYNKSQLFVDLCREQGYQVKYCKLENIDKDKEVVDSIKLYNKEQVKHTKLFLHNKNCILLDEFELLKIYMEIGDNNNKFADYKARESILQEELKQRLNFVGVFKSQLDKDPMLAQIIYDKQIFEGCVKSLPLYFKEEKIDNKQMAEFSNGIAFIEKENRLYKRLKLLKWIETELGIERFDVASIELNSEQANLFVSSLKEQKDLLPSLLDNTIGSKKRMEERITSKLSNLTTVDRIQKLVADLYNRFDDIITYEVHNLQKRIKGKNVYRTIYLKFQINTQTLEHHKKIQNMT